MSENIKAQYMQAALAIWRGRNPWASSIPFARFPQAYKDLIEASAMISATLGTPHTANFWNGDPFQSFTQGAN